MKTATANRTQQQQSLKRVGQNLYRSDVSGKYYGIFKTGRKQRRRSLRRAGVSFRAGIHAAF